AGVAEQQGNQSAGHGLRLVDDQTKGFQAGPLSVAVTGREPVSGRAVSAASRGPSAVGLLLGFLHPPGGPVAAGRGSAGSERLGPAADEIVEETTQGGAF